MGAYTLCRAISVVAFVTFSGAIVGCDESSESKPHGIELIPAGKWELHIKDASGQSITATAVPVFEGSQQNWASWFEEFRRPPAVIRSDDQGVITLTRGESANAPAPQARNVRCVRVSAPGYLDKEIDVFRIFKSKSNVILVTLQRQPTTMQE